MEDLKGEKFDADYYAEELLKVPKDTLDNAFRIDPNKKIKYRVRKGQKEAFVHYLGWPEKFAEWIPEKNISDI